MIVASGLAIAVGLVTVILATRGKIPAIQASLGVFMIMIGLNGFNSIRMAKLEETVKKLKEKLEHKGPCPPLPHPF